MTRSLPARVNIAIASSIYDIRIVAKNIAMYRYTRVLLQAYSLVNQQRELSTSDLNLFTTNKLF